MSDVYAKMRERKASDRFDYCVEGRGEFPVDMLRYDGSWPYQESDSAAIRSDAREHRVVNLRGTAPPNLDRWRSFGWTVQVVSFVKSDGSRQRVDISR